MTTNASGVFVGWEVGEDVTDPADHRRVHLSKPPGAYWSVYPLCGNPTGMPKWTTDTELVTCGRCIRVLGWRRAWGEAW